MGSKEDQKETAPRIRHQVNLEKYNTLGIGSTAEVFVEIKKKEHLRALGEAGFFQAPYPFILGGGSNILFRGSPGVPVLKMSVPGIGITEENEYEALVKAGGGVIWHEWVKWAVQRGLGGIENLALIPGTTGAAPVQNIGAYGVELEEVFESLEIFDFRDQTFKTFGREDCRFGYRDSIFKNELKGNVLVTEVTLRLQKAPHTIHAGYYALKEYFRSRNITAPGIADVFHAVVYIRKSKLPDPQLLGNAGSFFKNPVVRTGILQDLQKKFSDIPSFDVRPGYVKIPAGWLIEQAGWKGNRSGNVGTYKNQALVIVNHGGATGKEIFEYAEEIRESVREKFGIGLVPEVNVIG